MLWTELVLGLYLFKLLTCVNEQDIVIFLAAFLENKNTGRNACTIEDVGWQSDNGIYVVLFSMRKRRITPSAFPRNNTP